MIFLLAAEQQKEDEQQQKKTRNSTYWSCKFLKRKKESCLIFMLRMSKKK